MKLFDPFQIKQAFDAVQWGVEALGEVKNLAALAREVRKSVLPIELLDGKPQWDTQVFPEFLPTPIPFFQGKKVGLVCSGGSGALVSLCGVKRALEEAGVEIAAVSVCSGSALWGSLIAAGLSAQEMVDFSFGLDPRVYLDFDVLDNARRVLGGFRGFTGLLEGKKLEALYNERLNGACLKDLPLPLYSITYNMDLGRVEYFGPDLSPNCPVGRVIRIAIALPLFVKSVKVGEYYYVDGGVINVFPVEPLVKYVPDLDFFIGVNCILPPGFAGENFHGWAEGRFTIIPAGRQLRFGHWVELARLNSEMVRDRFLMLNPAPFTAIRGLSFYRYFVDKELWLRTIIDAYDSTHRKLKQFAELGRDPEMDHGDTKTRQQLEGCMPRDLTP